MPFAPADDGLRLLVIDTKVRHHLADGQYGQRRASVEKAAEVLGLHSLREATERDLQRLEGELLRRARHIVTEIARVREVVALLDEGRLRDIGPLLDASHASLAHDYEVSCRELDLACEIARAFGRFRGPDDRRRVRRFRDRARAVQPRGRCRPLGAQRLRRGRPPRSRTSWRRSPRPVRSRC